MSRHTTFRIGGPADLFLTVMTKEQLSLLQKEANRLQIPLFLLGNGSDLLVSDKGIRGCVLMLSGDFHEISLVRGTEIACGSAVSLAGLCNFAKKNGLTRAGVCLGHSGFCRRRPVYERGSVWRRDEPSRFLGVLLAAFRGRGNAERSGSRLWYRCSVFMENGGVITGGVFALSQAIGSPSPCRWRSIIPGAKKSSR